MGIVEVKFVTVIHVRVCVQGCVSRGRGHCIGGVCVCVCVWGSVKSNFKWSSHYGEKHRLRKDIPLRKEVEQHGRKWRSSMKEIVHFTYCSLALCHTLCFNSLASGRFKVVFRPNLKLFE